MTSFFVSVSNGRTGSTYLSTSLNRITDIASDYELKWRPNYAPSPGHIFMDAGDRIADTLAVHLSGKPIIGSKFVFDPYTDAFINEGMVENLLNAFDDSIKIIHITRSYIDIFMSFYARGAVAVRNDETLKENSVLTKIAQPQGTELAQKKVTLSRAECLISMLNMYHNDLLCLEICRRSKAYMTVPYSAIGAKLHAICAFLGSQADEASVAKIVDRPSLKKLDPLDTGIWPDYDYMNEIAARFDSLLADEIENLPSGKRELKFPIVDGRMTIQCDDPRLTGVISAIMS